MDILSSKTKKPAEVAQSTSLELIKQTLSEVQVLQEAVKSGESDNNEFLVKTGELFTQSVEKLQEIATNADENSQKLIEQVNGVFAEIRDELKQTREAFDNMEFSPEIINKVEVPEVVIPDIKIPEIKNDIAAPDLSRLEDLFAGLPLLLREFVAELDLMPAEELRKALREMNKSLSDIAKKEWTANIFGGGGGGGGTNVPTTPTNRGIDIPVKGGGLVPEQYDDIQMQYTGSNVTQVDYYYMNGYLCTLTLEYTGSNLTRVTRTE